MARSNVKEKKERKIEMGAVLVKTLFNTGIKETSKHILVQCKKEKLTIAKKTWRKGKKIDEILFM